MAFALFRQRQVYDDPSIVPLLLGQLYVVEAVKPNGYQLARGPGVNWPIRPPTNQPLFA